MIVLNNYTTILEVYGLDPTCSSDQQHKSINPPFFCPNCYVTAKWNVSTGNKPNRVPVEWLPHNDSFCPVCDVKCKGGRPKKSTSNAGRPSLLHQHIQSIACKIPAIDLSQIVDTI